MARPLCREYVGALYHVTARGHARQDIFLDDEDRWRFLRVLERRLDELVTHPLVGTRLSYRRMLELQARFIGKTVLGEIARYPGFKVR